jgi:hypothetical protein
MQRRQKKLFPEERYASMCAGVNLGKNGRNAAEDVLFLAE